MLVHIDIFYSHFVNCFRRLEKYNKNFKFHRRQGIDIGKRACNSIHEILKIIQFLEMILHSLY